MDSNKDEALRCISIAKEAIASGNKKRALKFLGIARRLNNKLNVDDLLTACENLDSSTPAGTFADVKNDAARVKNETGDVKLDEFVDREKNYREEHVELIRKIKSKNDYYEILGLEKDCSVEEIRKAYRKLSLKVHPDKNNAPGSEEAFKKIAKAFKCLHDDDSRKQYHQTGFVDEYVYSQQNTVRHRRRRTGHEYFDDEFDADEIFRSFFNQNDMFRTSYVYRTRTTGADQLRVELGPAARKLVLFLQLLFLLLIILLAYHPLSKPEYSL